MLVVDTASGNMRTYSEAGIQKPPGYSGVLTLGGWTGRGERESQSSKSGGGEGGRAAGVGRGIREEDGGKFMVA